MLWRDEIMPLGRREPRPHGLAEYRSHNVVLVNRYVRRYIGNE